MRRGREKKQEKKTLKKTEDKQKTGKNIHITKRQSSYYRDFIGLEETKR